MSEHELKTWPDEFQAVWDGRKRFDVRPNRDRTFRVRDRLILREWRPDTEAYTGRELAAGVTYILHGPKFGVAEGYVAMSLRVLGPANDDHEYVGDGADCEACGEGVMHYLHGEQTTDEDTHDTETANDA